MMKTHYENHSGSVTSYGKATKSIHGDEVANKWKVGGYKPSAPTGGNQGGGSGRKMRKYKMNKQGSKSRSGGY